MQVLPEQVPPSSTLRRSAAAESGGTHHGSHHGSVFLRNISGQFALPRRRFIPDGDLYAELVAAFRAAAETLKSGIRTVAFPTEPFGTISICPRTDLTIFLLEISGLSFRVDLERRSA